VQTQETLDEGVMAFLQFEELLGNALLFFLYEQLRKEPRFQNTLAAFAARRFTDRGARN
jgi:hypothetical protein